jgi:hypothetical protein
LQTIVAVVQFSEVLPPKLKKFFQIRFAAVEGVGVLTILTLVIHPVGVLTILTLVIHLVFLTSFLEVHLRAIKKHIFSKYIITFV